MVLTILFALAVLQIFDDAAQSLALASKLQNLVSILGLIFARQKDLLLEDFLDVLRVSHGLHLAVREALLVFSRAVVLVLFVCIVVVLILCIRSFFDHHIATTLLGIVNVLI